VGHLVPALLAALLLVLLAVPAWGQGDPFRRGPAPAAPATGDVGSAPGDPLRAPSAGVAGDPLRAPVLGGGQGQAPGGFTLPVPLGRAVVQIALWQRDFHRGLTRGMREAGQSGSWAPALAIVALAFLYGVFHAAGPGHGKVVTATYFLARRAHILHGMLAGGIIAVVQAITAIVAVLALAWVLEISGTRIIGQTVYLELASYGLIAAIGLYMIYGALRGEGHHHHGPHSGAPGDEARSRTELISTAVAAGLRPCTGAILVLLFAMANGILLLGVVATFAMAVGVALTISVLGIVAILLRKGVALAVPSGGRYAALAHRSLAVTGALLITVLGALLFLGTLARLGAPL
jgi:ABC-type nickel/cobalt efflux system permease component RcnA